MTTPHVDSPGPRLLLAAALAIAAAAAGCSGADVAINGAGEGTEAFVAAPPAPPVVIDRDGIHEPPTPTPGPIMPIYPIRTPPPRPR